MAPAAELFDLDNILEAARCETGLDDFGPDDFLQPLKVWLQEGRNALTNEGRITHLQFTHRCLVNRLRFADDLLRHSEILQEDVSDPIVVLGFPRSGTTVLQRMLSADPAVQSLDFWRVLNPAPFPGETSEPTARIAFGQEIENAVRTLKPALFAAHPSVARDAEEDWFLHHFTFQHPLNACCAPFTSNYIAYLRAIPRQPSYDYVGDMLRYLQWQDGGRRGRRWILKSPAHIGCLEEMLGVHPNATFVYPRRDFQTVMASFCYTLEQALDSTISIDPVELGELSLELWLAEMRRFYATRKRLGAGLKILEIPYLDLLTNPIRHIRDIYAQAASELNEAGEAAISRWIADNPPNKHGKNVYTLDRYGLTPERVKAAFAEFEDFPGA